MKVTRLVASGLPYKKAVALVKRREFRLTQGVTRSGNQKTGHWVLPVKE